MTKKVSGTFLAVYSFNVALGDAQVTGRLPTAR